MTREEAIEEIKNYNKNYPSGLSKECRDYIIKALEQEAILDKITEIIDPLRHLSIDEMSGIEWQILREVDKMNIL